MPTTLEGQVDKLIGEFDAWFQKETGNEPVVRSERAILKTFCWYITHACNTTSLPGVTLPAEEKSDDKEARVRDAVQSV